MSAEPLPEWANTSIEIFPSHDEQLVIMRVPVTVEGVSTHIELCLPPESARDLAFTLTTTSMKIEEERLP